MNIFVKAVLLPSLLLFTSYTHAVLPNTAQDKTSVAHQASKIDSKSIKSKAIESKQTSSKSDKKGGKAKKMVAYDCKESLSQCLSTATKYCKHPLPDHPCDLNPAQFCKKMRAGCGASH